MMNLLPGSAVDDMFGWSVSEAGDVNGDGYADIIVGAPYNDESGSSSGRAYIFYGGTVLDITADVILSGDNIANAYFGVSVSAAGDVNSDGYDDVIVSAEGTDYGGNNAGTAYIYFGGNPMNNTYDWFVDGTADDYLGGSVSTAGDVNGDGYSDVIVGVRLDDLAGPDFGSAFIYLGGSPMNTSVDFILTGDGSGDQFGLCVSDAGDVNGDGYDDVIVGAYNNDAGGIGAGRAYIYFGGSTVYDSAYVILTGSDVVEFFGWSVAGCGDVNGDGFDDVIVGSPNNDAGGSGTGRVFIYYGGSSMNSNEDVIITGSNSNSFIGFSVASAGDVNMDGYDDVIVGSNNYNNNTGQALVFFGSVNMNNVADITFNGVDYDNNFGYSVSKAGDINGDQLCDIIIGAFGTYAVGGNEGKAYLYLSSSPPTKPRIMGAKDVPGDQGGHVFVNFVRSSYDALGINNKITEYRIEISTPPGIGGFSWSHIGSVSPNSNPLYTYIAATPNDSSGSISGTFFYRVTARTSNNNEYWRSNIMSGHSVDNLSPTSVMSFAALAQGDNNKLSWKANTESDLKNYYIYRSLNSTIDPDATTPILITNDTTKLDLSVPPGDSYYFIRAKDVHDNFGPLTQLSSPLGLRQITFSSLLEGFYNSGSGTMVEDTVTLILKNISPPYTTIDQTKVKLSSIGAGLPKFRQAVNGTSYYLAIKHRNSIETWTKIGQQFTNSEMTYDFTTSSTQAYGDNLKQKGIEWCIYGGDVNQDGLVDLSDEIAVINDVNAFNTGRIVTDLNGDESADLSDIIIVVNNTNGFISKQAPETKSVKMKEVQNK